MYYFHHYLIIGTFDVQNIQLSTNISNAILIDCDIIEGSQATGVLIIAYSMADFADIRYEVVVREESRVQAVLSCLQGQSYTVLLHVLNENGVPFDRPASLPLSSNVNRNSDTIPCKQNVDWEMCIVVSIILFCRNLNFPIQN